MARGPKTIAGAARAKIGAFEENVAVQRVPPGQPAAVVDFDLYGMARQFFCIPAITAAREAQQSEKVVPPDGQHSFKYFLVKKSYILDTNVLLHDPNSLLSFEENTVLLPIEVIEEIDRFKRESPNWAKNARTVSRMLDGFRGEGRLSEGITLPNGGQLRDHFSKSGTGQERPRGFGADSVDNRILSLAFGIKKSQPKEQTILVSKDINLRIKADALGMLAEDYENDRVLIADLYTGMIELTVQRRKNCQLPRQR